MDDMLADMQCEEQEEPMAPTPIECMDGPHGCHGDVEARASLTGTGTPMMRCDAHHEDAVERTQQSRRDYPDSDVAPRWFDPAYAGERWDDE